jgi:hypothetical protein
MVLGGLGSGSQEAHGAQSIYAIGWRYGHVLDAPGMRLALRLLIYDSQ